MTIQEALKTYKLQFSVEEQSERGGYAVVRLAPTGAGGTITKLRRRLPDLSVALGAEVEMSIENYAIYLTYKVGSVSYNFFDYNGYIDYNSDDVPFIVGFSKGQMVFDSLGNARHILVAGASGSGKSVFLHGLINTFLCNPNLYLWLVDYKRIEFPLYDKYALVALGNYDQLNADKFLADLEQKMEERLDDMQRLGATSFSEYKKYRPEARRNVLIIDELSSVIIDQSDRDYFFSKFYKIALSGRYTGFHLILSTQLANGDVTDELMKLNIPTRMAFRTASKADSKKILDDEGAEWLGGNGDSLYRKRGLSELEHVQTLDISFEDIKKRLMVI